MIIPFIFFIFVMHSPKLLPWLKNLFPQLLEVLPIDTPQLSTYQLSLRIAQMAHPKSDGYPKVRLLSSSCLHLRLISLNIGSPDPSPQLGKFWKGYLIFKAKLWVRGGLHAAALKPKFFLNQILLPSLLFRRCWFHEYSLMKVLHSNL